MTKRGLCLLLALVTIFSLAVPAFAEEAPVEEPVVTEEPVVIEAPAEVTEAPVEVTEAPVEATEAPVEVTEAPVEVTEAPVEVTEAPAEATEAPVEATEAPIEATEAPVEEDEPVAAAATPSPSPSPAPVIGTCGAGVTWAFDEITGTLTISGGGPMNDLSYGGSATYYAHHASIKKVVVGSGVTRIGSAAFHANIGDYKNLTEVVIADTVTSIGKDAFNFCDSLSTVSLSNGLTTIEERAFSSCKALADVTIPESVTSIGKSAFNSSGLTSVKLPSGLKTIEEGALGYCTNLKEVVIPEGVTSIGTFAFYNNKSMTSVTLPSTVTSIGIIAFGSCPALTSIDLPDGLQTIGREAFEYSGLTDVTIPAGVGQLVATFYGCSSLKTLTVLNKDCQLMNYDEGSMQPVKASAPGAAGEPMTVDVHEIEPLCPKTTTIRGYANSTAEAYAKKNGNPFEKLGGTPAPTAAPAPTDAPEAKPATPKLSKAENTASGVKITWQAVDGAAKYRVYYKTTGGWKKLADTTKTSYTWTKAKSGTKYSFTVKAYGSGGESGYDKTGKSVTYVAAPTVKLSLTADGIKVSWSACKGAGAYRVFYKTSKNGSWKKIGDTTKTSYTRKNAKLTSGKTYYFTVRCVKAKNSKTYVSAYDTAGKSVVFLKAPTVKAAKTASGIKVSWDKIAGATKYRVYYKTSKNGKWTKIGDTTKTSYTRKNAKLKSGTTYWFTVRAVKGSALSGYNTSGVSVKYKK